MFNGIYFEFPWLILGIFFFIFCAQVCKMRLPSIYFPHASQFMQKSMNTSKILFILKWLSILMLFIALASPVKDEPYELAPKKGHELALIIDASESMRSHDFDANNPGLSRFDVVKEIVADFVKKRVSDNLGLVVFGEYSFIASPLTYDENILSKIVSQLEIGMAGKYTVLYEALAQGVNLLKMSKSKSKVAILLTDGYSTQGVDKIPLDIAIDIAKKEGVKVYPIGIGAANEYNANVLLKIAKETGGVAFGASSARELEAVYTKINALEKVEIKTQTYSNVKYYYMYPLLIGFISLILYIMARNLRGVH